MLTLAAADTLAVRAGTSATVTLTIDGMELSAGVETYAVLYQGQPTNVAATVYTVPANTMTFVKTIHVVNTTGVERTFALYRGGTNNAHRLSPDITLPANGFAVYAADGWHVYTASGSILTSDGSASGTSATFIAVAKWLMD